MQQTALENKIIQRETILIQKQFIQQLINSLIIIKIISSQL
jgi:hypothetical protein